MCLPTIVFFKNASSRLFSPQTLYHHPPQLRTASLETLYHTLLTCSGPSPHARCWAQLCDPYRGHKIGLGSVLTSVAVVWPCLALSERGCSKEETFQGLADSVLTARGAGGRRLRWSQREEGFGTVPNQRSWRLHAVLSLPESSDTTSVLALRRPISKREEGRPLRS